MIFMDNGPRGPIALETTKVNLILKDSQIKRNGLVRAAPEVRKEGGI